MSKTHIDDIIDILVDTVAVILKYRAGVAMGLPPPPGYEGYDQKRQSELVELAKPLIQSSQQIRIIEANSAQGIIKMVSKGKLHPEDALKMLQVIKEKKKIDKIELEEDVKMKLLEMIS